SFVLAQNKPAEAAKLPPFKVSKLAGIDARFVFSIIADNKDGFLIGTEDDGIFHYQPDKILTQYSPNVYDPKRIKNSIRDPNGYALAVDKLGRFWAGHLNIGVSVFNGEKWKNYDVVDGPIGERIFDMKICPVDGDVWMATSAGITRYNFDKDNWEHITRADGLLEDQASVIAFKNDGTLIVGTQCHGIAIFNRNKKGEYKHAKNIVAPNRFGTKNCSPVPLTPIGNGLPSNQINDILVSKNNQSIWIATNAGLVQTNNEMTIFKYWRGKDYINKIHGLVGGTPKDFKPPASNIDAQLLPEDHVTCLAEDDNDNLLYGMLTKGFVMFDQKNGTKIFCDKKTIGLSDDYITSICPMSNEQFLVGSYGGGVVCVHKADVNFIDSKIPQDNQDTNNIDPPLPYPSIQKQSSIDEIKYPSVQKKLSIDELKKMRAKLLSNNTPLPKIYAAAHGEDWRTQGNWLGRISSEWAILCAMSAPFDRYVYHSRDFYDVTGFIGPKRAANDDLRRWVYKLQTDDERALYDPLNGNRRPAEWDDHGEAYSRSQDGPDLWYVLEIKHAGVFKLGMYFLNMDGHDGLNRFRDYLIEIYPSEKGCSTVDSDRPIYSNYAESQTANITPLVKTRVKNFWHGTYKFFAVKGPGRYLVKIDRNYSFNTIMSGIFIQQIYGQPTEDTKYGIPKLRAKYKPPEFPEYYEDAESMYYEEFWQELDQKYNNTDTIEHQTPNRIAIYTAATRDAEQKNAPKDIKELAECFKWRLNQWGKKQKTMWNYTTRLGLERLAESNPQIKEHIKNQNNEKIPEFINEWPR
ncbi:MAG: hypothetical protein LBQ66_05975, partial [Planctomycetaceae bacterium]|nr:hypothetical protein [Planctomycetaceae bacterium]